MSRSAHENRRRRGGRRWARLALPLLALGFLPARVFAGGGDLVWFFQGIEDVNTIDEIEDQDSDDVPDIVLESYDAGGTGDHLYCLSGGSPGPLATTIWSTRPPGGPSHSGGWGDECMQVTPDLTGDGTEDVLLGTAWGGRTAYVIDGTNGAVHWDFDTYSDSPPIPPESGWVYTISWIPDTNGDSFPDVVFGCGSDNNRVYHMSGQDGTLLWSLNLVDAVFASAALEDVTSDGKGDVVIGVGDNADHVWCLRGGSTANPVVWDHPLAGSCLAAARIEDISGDSVNDVLAGTWDSSVLAFNGVTGDTLWESVFPGFAYVQQIAVLDDVNDDGAQDAAIGTWDDRAFVISGADGTQIWSFPTGGDVWTVSRVADLTADGINDVVAGSFDQFVYLLDGVTGTEVWKYNTGNRLYYVKGVSDLTGNSRPDVMAGSQMLSGPPGGRAYLLEGGEDATSADLPVFVEGVPGPAGLLVRLHGALAYDACFVERHEGEPNGAAAAQRFRREVAEAYREGLLTPEQAMKARSQDPQIHWTKISGELPIRGGRAEFVDGSAEVGKSYTYRFALLSESRVVGYSPSATLTRTKSDGALAIPEIRTRPNPVAASQVRIEFRVPRPQSWRLDVFDAGGRRVAAIDRRDVHQGDVSVEWDGRDARGRRLPNGVYFLRVEADEFVSSKKVTILR
jgi:outer membrane protein assembly factor BamB